jgi:hypothetical protein
MATVAHRTFDYLKPYAGSALQQLASQASGRSSGRTLYMASVQPIYERALGYAAPLVLLVLLIATVRMTNVFRGWPARRTAIALAAFGSLYFVSLPFILSTRGAEGARRSWVFTLAALAVLLAFPLARWLGSPDRPWWPRVLVPLGLFVLLIGNTGAGLNDAYRFPGPYLFGSDTRSLTRESIALSKTFGALHPEARIVSDRYTSLALDAYGQTFSASPSSGFPTYDLFLRDDDPDPFLVHELESSEYHYLVVDERLSTSVPLLGIYFVGGEPALVADGRSRIPQRALDRFGTVPWATKVMATSNYSVYRLNFRAVGTPECDVAGCGVRVP